MGNISFKLKGVETLWVNENLFLNHKSDLSMLMGIKIPDRKVRVNSNFNGKFYGWVMDLSCN